MKTWREKKVCDKLSTNPRVIYENICVKDVSLMKNSSSV